MSFLIVVVFFLVVIVVIVARNHARGMTKFKLRKKNSSASNLLTILRRVFCGFTVYRSENSVYPDDCGFEYSEHSFYSEKNVKISGWYVPVASAKGLVLLFNWFGGCKSDNLVAADCFLDLGYSVFLVDLRGHGDSSGMETYFGYFEYRDVLAAVKYAYEQFTFQKILIYGVSLGAVSAMKAYSQAQVDIDGFILEAPFDRLINTIKHRIRAFKVPGVFFPHLLALLGGIEQGYNPYSFNPYVYAQAIDVPVLVIYGEDDPFITLAETEYLMDNLAEKKLSRLFIAKGHGHGSLAIHDKVLFKKQVSGYLKECIERE